MTSEKQRDVDVCWTEIVRLRAEIDALKAMQVPILQPFVAPQPWPNTYTWKCPICGSPHCYTHVTCSNGTQK